MGVEANTFEQIEVKNENEKTAQLAEQIGNYICKQWDIRSLKLVSDGAVYETDELQLTPDSDIYNACRSLSSVKHFSIALRSVSGLGLDERKEYYFLSCLDDGGELSDLVTYKSTDYYDTDEFVDLCVYGKGGLKTPEYNCTAADVSDIESWYSYTPEVRFASESAADNEELHELIIKKLTEILGSICGCDEAEIEDQITDDWVEYGEILLGGTLSFPNEKVDRITELLNEVCLKLREADDCEYEIKICAVPNGENDYDFASVCIAADHNGKVTAKYSRF